MVTAAFIGPGTVTLCSMAGIRYGYDLLWALLLSLIATVILQEMAARLGIVTQNGLAENIRSAPSAPLLKNLMLILVFSAIIIGNAAYEAGNINGAALGLQAIFDTEKTHVVRLICGLTALVLVIFGGQKSLLRLILVLVSLMSLSFIGSAWLVLPNWQSILSGLFLPQIPQADWLTVAGLVGTTIVPYNLFLHATLAKNKWKNVSGLKDAQTDARISVFIGGIISMSIVLAAAGSGLSELKNALDLAEGLKPLYGEWANYLLGIGLFGAGLSSSLTAPLAAGYVAAGCLGWSSGGSKEKWVRIFVVLIGLIGGSLSLNAIGIITFAQAANGLLLPVIVLFLWHAVNDSKKMGIHKNKLFINLITGLIFLISLGLGVKTLISLAT